MKKIITFLSSFFLIISLNVNADDEELIPTKLARNAYRDSVKSMKDFTDIKAWGKDATLTADARIVAMFDGLILSLIFVALNDDGTANMKISSGDSEAGIIWWSTYATEFTESENKIFETHFQEIVKQYNDSPRSFSMTDTNGFLSNAKSALTFKLMQKIGFFHSSQNVLAAKNFAHGFSSMFLAKSPACVPHSGGSCASPGM